MKKIASEGEGGAFLFVEAIPFIRAYYVMLDIASIEITYQPFDPPQSVAHAVIKDRFLNFLLINNLPYFLFMN